MSFPEDHAPIEPGHVYVAPPDGHLLVERDGMRVAFDPRENGHRPAIDPTFRSAASAFGVRVVGVLLSGLLHDGTAGMWAVKTHGGITVIQDPEEAEYPDMPGHAHQAMQLDYELPVARIADLIDELARTPLTSLVRQPEVGRERTEGMQSDEELRAG